MTDADVDRSLRQWMSEREPTSVPESVRQLARMVPMSTPEPVLWRVRGAFSREVLGGAPRVGLVLAVLGLLLAAIAGGLIAGSAAQPAPAPVVDRWGAFVVGQQAPTIEFTTVGDALTDGDDATLEFEDLVGSLVVVYVPDVDAAPPVTAIGALAGATHDASGSTAFIVAAPLQWAQVLDADAGVVTAEPPAALLAGRSGRGPAILVVDRRGIVAAVFEASLPTPGQLAQVLDRTEVRR